MRKPNPLLLTYLAQVRQLPCRNVWLHSLPAFTTRHILHIKMKQNAGISRKGIVIIGTVRVVGLVERSGNTGAWWKVVGYWQVNTICISSPSHAKGRK